MSERVGLTTVRAFRQSKRQESRASVERMRLVALYVMFCFLLDIEAMLFPQKQILAETAARERTNER